MEQFEKRRNKGERMEEKETWMENWGFNEILVDGKITGDIRSRKVEEAKNAKEDWFSPKTKIEKRIVQLILNSPPGLKYGLNLKGPGTFFPKRGDKNKFSEVYFKIEDNFVSTGILSSAEGGDDVGSINIFIWKSKNENISVKDLIQKMRATGLKIEKTGNYNQYQNQK